MISTTKNKIKNYLVKVIINGKPEELKNFGTSEIEVVDNMVDIPIVEEIVEILELETGKEWTGNGSLENLRKIKLQINSTSGGNHDFS